MTTEPREGQIWITRPWRIGDRRRVRLLRLVGVTSGRIAYVVHSDTAAGRPIVRRRGAVDRFWFLRSHDLYQDAP